MRKSKMLLRGIITFAQREQMSWYINDAKRSGHVIVYVNNAALMYR